MDLNKLTRGEKMNLVLAIARGLEAEPPFANRGRIQAEDVARATGLSPEETQDLVTELRRDEFVQEEQENEKIFIGTTEKTKATFLQFEKLTLNETSLLILKKSYEFYQRCDYNIDLQMNSVLTGCAIGIDNGNKVSSAVKNLIEKGLLRKLVILRDSIHYMITERGINLIENEERPSRPEAVPPSIVIQGSNQNVSINSMNVSQTINSEDLAALFSQLEELIRNKLPEENRNDAMADLETVKELSSVKEPKVPLIQRILSNFDKLPILVEVASKLKDFFESLPH